MVAVKMVRAFDVKVAFAGRDYTSQDWQNYIAPLQAAALMAKDDTLSADILSYYDDLLWNGADAYNGQALTTLINYVQAVYGVNVFPNS